MGSSLLECGWRDRVTILDDSKMIWKSDLSSSSLVAWWYRCVNLHLNPSRWQHPFHQNMLLLLLSQGSFFLKFNDFFDADADLKSTLSIVSLWNYWRRRGRYVFRHTSSISYADPFCTCQTFTVDDTSSLFFVLTCVLNKADDRHESCPALVAQN